MYLIENPTPFIKWVKHQTVNITNILTENSTSNATLDMAATASTKTVEPDDSMAESSLVIPSSRKLEYINDNQITTITDLKMEQTQVSTLTIKKTTENDTAVYECLIINKKGIARRSSALTVKPSKIFFVLICLR